MREVVWLHFLQHRTWRSELVVFASSRFLSPLLCCIPPLNDSAHEWTQSLRHFGISKCRNVVIINMRPTRLKLHKRQWCSTTPRCMHLPKLASRLDLAMVLLRPMSSLSSQWQEAMTVDSGSTYVRTWVLRGVNRNVYIVPYYA